MVFVRVRELQYWDEYPMIDPISNKTCCKARFPERLKTQDLGWGKLFRSTLDRIKTMNKVANIWTTTRSPSTVSYTTPRCFLILLREYHTLPNKAWNYKGDLLGSAVAV